MANLNINSLFKSIDQFRAFMVNIPFDTPRANGAKRRSGRKPGARVTNSARLFKHGKKRT